MKDYVTRVIDGDTFDVAAGVRIRLENVDAPEIDAPQGPVAKNKLEELILHRYVEYKEKTRDEYGRIVAQVWEDDTNVNELMNEFIANL